MTIVMVRACMITLSLPNSTYTIIIIIIIIIIVIIIIIIIISIVQIISTELSLHRGVFFLWTFQCPSLGVWRVGAGLQQIPGPSGTVGQAESWRVFKVKTCGGCFSRVLLCFICCCFFFQFFCYLRWLCVNGCCCFNGSEANQNGD